MAKDYWESHTYVQAMVRSSSYRVTLFRVIMKFREMFGDPKYMATRLSELKGEMNDKPKVGDHVQVLMEDFVNNFSGLQYGKLTFLDETCIEIQVDLGTAKSDLYKNILRPRSDVKLVWCSLLQLWQARPTTLRS